MPHAHGYAAQSAETPLAPYSFERRALRPNDVRIEILYCGVCHSDLHTVRSEWPGTVYPSVPGHEIVGRVTAVGPEVTQHAEGDLVAVGCLVDSCRTCSACQEGLEQYCETGLTGTYNSPDRVTGENTLGGYSDSIMVREEFVLKIRHDESDLAAVAPLLCAGITTWSPLRHWKVGPGSKVGVVGIGGLGHMGVKLAKALGAHVVAFTTSPDKVADASALGADEVVVSRDPAQMAAQTGTLDFILNTVAAPH
ncbi:MAG: NAD(P)-dependent alcohol dehydrogenase, partial [Sphingosinicella sp.]|uniref:NAD(P)-dependent alcohol dehydrogenase n=1 Tax=Sphingosinicella sp. TaxID=1917971 RepID=UPI004037C9B6